MFKKLRWNGDDKYKDSTEKINFPNLNVVFHYSVFEGLDLNYYVGIVGGEKDKTIPVDSMKHGLQVAEEEHQKILQGFFEALENMKIDY